jgi:hypothetical protein
VTVGVTTVGVNRRKHVVDVEDAATPLFTVTHGERLMVKRLCKSPFFACVDFSTSHGLAFMSFLRKEIASVG